MFIKFDISDELLCYPDTHNELNTNQKIEFSKIVKSITRKIEYVIISIDYNLSIGMKLDIVNFKNIFNLTKKEVDFLYESCNNYATIYGFIMHPNYLIVELQII